MAQNWGSTMAHLLRTQWILLILCLIFKFLKSGLGLGVLGNIFCHIGHCQEKDSEAVQIVLFLTYSSDSCCGFIMPLLTPCYVVCLRLLLCCCAFSFNFASFLRSLSLSSLCILFFSFLCTFPAPLLSALAKP